MRVGVDSRAVIRGLRVHFAADAAGWHLTNGTAVAIAVLPIVVACAVAAARLSRPLSGFLTDEGSVLEWTQVALLTIAVAAVAASGARAVRAGRPGSAALNITALVVLIAVIGEELSWGQTATNLHLLRGAIRTINVAMIFVLGALVLLSVATALRRGHRGRSRPLDYPMPPLALVPAFAIPVGYRSVRLITDGGASGPFSEMSELSLYFGIAVFAILLLRRASA